MKQLDINFNRDRVKALFDYYGGKGISPEQSMIRIEKAFVAGQGKYDFNIKKETPTGAEQAINRNDLFLVTHLLVAHMIEVDAKPGQAPLLSYGLQSGDHLPAHVSGYTTSDIDALYNGSLLIKTGQVVNVSALPLINFRKVPQTQPQQLPYIASATDSNAAAGTPIAIANTVDYVSNGIMPEFDLSDLALQMTERIVFAGTQDHKVEISFPCAAAATFASATANTTPKLVFMAFGYKVPGGTSETFKNDAANPFKDVI